MTWANLCWAACWLTSVWGRQSEAGKQKTFQFWFFSPWRKGDLSLSTWLRGRVWAFFSHVFPTASSELTAETRNHVCPPPHCERALPWASVCQRRLSFVWLFNGIIYILSISLFLNSILTTAPPLFFFFWRCSASFTPHFLQTHSSTPFIAVLQWMLSAFAQIILDSVR